MVKKESITIPQIKEIKSQTKKFFIVRHFDSTSKKTSQVGPFTNELEAKEAVKTFLKNGTCSWLVSYGS